MGLEGMATGRGCPWETGEGCRIELGASLPPRKRLLAGLKQNGWLSSPSATVPSFSSWQSTAASRASEDLKLEVDLGGATMIVEATKAYDVQQCVGSGTESSNAVEKTEIFKEDKDLDQGKRNMEPKRPNSPSPSWSSFVHAEKKPGMSRKVCVHQRESTVNGASGDVKSASASDSGVPSSRSKREGVSVNEMVEAAKLTAAIAAKTAAEARATAATKAEAAAKAAAVAKAALDAAAILARKEARNLRRNTARARSRAMEKNKKTDMKRERTNLGVSQMSPPVNDEELARQLHRAINSSPRISRSQISLQPMESGKFVEVIPATEWVKGAARTSIIQGKDQPVRPRSLSLKEGRKQEAKMARQNSRRSQSESKELESQSTSELNKSTVDVADTVTSFQRSGSFPAERAGENITDCGQLGDADTSVNGSAINFSSQEEKINKDADMNIACIISSPTLLESTRESFDLSICKHPNGSKRRHVESKVSELGKGEDEIATEEVCAGKGLDADMLAGLGQKATVETDCAKSPDVLHHNYAEDPMKQSRISMQGLFVVMEEPSVTLPQADEGGKQVEKQWYAESWKQTDADDRIKIAESTMEAKQKVSSPVNYSNLGSSIEDENIECLDMEMKDGGGCKDNSWKNEGHLIKHRSLDSGSKTVSKGLSNTKQARVRVPSWRKGTVKGIASGAQSFGGGINVTPFGSASPVRLRTPAFASGPTARHS